MSDDFKPGDIAVCVSRDIICCGPSIHFGIAAKAAEKNRRERHRFEWGCANRKYNGTAVFIRDIK